MTALDAIYNGELMTGHHMPAPRRRRPRPDHRRDALGAAQHSGLAAESEQPGPVYRVLPGRVRAARRGAGRPGCRADDRRDSS